MLPVHMLEFFLHQLASVVKGLHQRLSCLSCDRALDPPNFLFLRVTIPVEVRAEEFLVELKKSHCWQAEVTVARELIEVLQQR